MRLSTFKDDETGEVFPKLAEDIKRLTNNTVNLTDASGKLKSTFQIYKEIGKVYKDLDQSCPTSRVPPPVCPQPPAW